MYKIKNNCILPSSAFTLTKKNIKKYGVTEKKPEIGDVIYGEVVSLGEHLALESINGRIHTIHSGTRAIFTFGNRYAPDCFEGVVPDKLPVQVDLLARSGLIGNMRYKNGMVSNPTKIKVLGYLLDERGDVINTRTKPLLKPKDNEIGDTDRAKIILSIGTSMNSGKSYAAAACCYALSSMGKQVRAAKITGTASLKDILFMEDCGASHIADFSWLGYPSTYMLEEHELLNIFKTVDLKYGNNPENYIVMEFADGIMQRETSMLLKMPEVLARIHKIIFCAQDALGAYGALSVLKNDYNIVPDAISGICSSSPLAINEFKSLSNIPVMYSAERDFKKIYEIIK